MKKSLSLLLAIAMVFSMFASVASAADELTAQQKYDALKAKGIFSGMEDGSAGLDQDMTRAQFARVVSLLMELDLNNPPATASFSDVQPAHWAFEEVEAVKKAGVMSGYSETVFGDKDNITIEQMARVYVDALGLEVDEEAEVEGASEWAQKYVEAAVEAGLISADADFTANATRAQLAEVSYAVAGKVGIFEPAKVSIVSAKPTGVKEVTVVLDKAVDTEKATLTLKRISSTVSTTTTWAEDRRSATIALKDTKLLEGEYTVTLSGLAEDQVEKNSASFSAENEKVVKLEFTAPSDTIAQSNKVRIDFEALNQYDEPTSLSAGSFDVYASTVTEPDVKKDANGKLYVAMDTDDSQEPNPVMIPNLTQISVNVVNTDSQVSVNKTFKLGSKPYVAKVELGEAVYSNGDDYLSKQGDKVVIELIQYDQYGHRISEDSGTLFNASVNVLPYLNEIKATLDDDNNDDFLDVVVGLEHGDAKVTGEYTVSVFGGSSASKVINVKATKYAATVELEAPTLAAGDKDKYITINAYDTDGNKLTAEDIVTNYENDHIHFGISGNLTIGATSDVPSSMLAANGKNELAIVKSGEHKGKLHIASVTAKGTAHIYVNITPQSANGIAFNKNFQFNIQDKRYPQSLRVEEDNATKAVAGGESKLKIVAIDNYGDTIKDVIGTVEERSRTVTYDVYVQVIDVNGTGVSLTGTSLGAHTNLSDVLDKDLKFVAGTSASVNDTLEVRISLRKINTANNNVIDDTVSTVTKKMTVIDPERTKLTYSVKSIDTLFDAEDDQTMTGTNYDSFGSKHARTVEIEAKDGSNNKVAIPSNYVVSVTSSDSNIVKTNSHNKVVGVKEGSATVRVFHKTATGESGTLNQAVTVKSDAISVASLSSENSAKLYLNALKNAYELMELKAKDNYNTEYKAVDDGVATGLIKEYDPVLGIRYTVTDVRGGSVTVDNNINSATFGQFTITGSVTGFTLTATAPNGETAVTAVSVLPTAPTP